MVVVLVKAVGVTWTSKIWVNLWLEKLWPKERKSAGITVTFFLDILPLLGSRGKPSYGKCMPELGEWNISFISCLPKEGSLLENMGRLWRGGSSTEVLHELLGLYQSCGHMDLSLNTLARLWKVNSGVHCYSGIRLVFGWCMWGIDPNSIAKTLKCEVALKPQKVNWNL